MPAAINDGLTSAQRYALRHPERCREAQRRFRQHHPDRVKATSLRYCEANREKLRAKRRAFYQTHKEQERAYNRRYAEANRERASHWHRAWKYGVSLEDWRAMQERQGNRCGICAKPFCAALRPHYDHCHKNGKGRGALCGPCNRGIGMFKDSPELLKAAIAYLTVGPQAAVPPKETRRPKK